MVPCRLRFVKPMRRKMQIATDWARDWLRLVVIIKTGELAPDWIAAKLNQTGANHDPKPQPAKEPDDENGRTAFGERSTIQQRAEQDGQESSLEELDLPAVAVPDLADMNDRHVHRPKHREQKFVSVTAENNETETESSRGEERQPTIGNAKPEQPRHL